MPARKMRSISPKRRKAYESIKSNLRKRGYKGRRLKEVAARIANKGKTRFGRKKMAKKAARKRKRTS